MIKISIIIPCYNQENYMAECLDSVIKQTFTDFEAIVINDGSTDGSLSVIEEYIKKDNRIKLINQANHGVIAARNNAIKQAQGKYIYPLDGDDKIAFNCLELLHKAMLEGKGDVVYSQTEFFGEKSGIFKIQLPTKLNMAKVNKVVCSALYKKSDAIKYGGYDENMKDGLEDWEFWCNFIYDDKTFYRLSEILFFYRQTADSRNKISDKKKAEKLKKYIIKKHKLYLYNIINGISFFLYQKKETNSGYILIKICKIPIYKKKL